MVMIKDIKIENMNTQIISEYPNYIITTDGKVFNKKSKKELATQLNTRGYKTVNLWNNNKMRKIMIHRLVALTFIPNHTNLPCINHKDKNKINNCVENLEWCSYKYNSNYSKNECILERQKSGYRVPIKQFVNNAWIYFDSINEAHKQTGISINTIRTSLKKVYNKPKYVFEYVNSVME